MSPLSHIPARLQRAVVPYILIVLTLIAIGTAVTFGVQARRDAAQSASADAAIRTAAIANCERQNEVRKVARIAVVTLAHVQILGLKQQIATSHAIPPKFFPDIPPRRFRALIHAQNSDRRANIRALKQVQSETRTSFQAADCTAVNPLPATR